MEPTNFFNPFAAALGWMVLHSIWQITLLYLLYQVAAAAFRRHSQALYFAALLGMAASAVWSACTFANAWENYAQSNQWQAPTDSATVLPVLAPTATPLRATPSAVPPRPWYRQFDQIYESWAAPIGWLWSLGALVLALRLLGGYWLSLHIRRVGVSPVPELWQQRSQHWCAQLGIRRPVQWLESLRISAPLTLGFWKPLVLFPAGMLLQLQPEQVEILLLHELAHIRRHDYLANLIQLTLEVCFFYHPLFWLLSKEARRQREFCCDDLVLRHHHDRLIYAKTLTDLQLSSITLNKFAMHAIGKSAFAQRILRLLNIQPEKSQRSPGLVLVFIFLLSGAAMSWSVFTTNALPKPSEISLLLPDRNPPLAPAHFSALRANDNPSETAPAQLLEIKPGLDTSSPSIIAVEAAKMNVFYIGVDNPVTVAVPGYDCARLQVRLSGKGSVVPQGNCQYNVLVTAPGNVDIAVFTNENGIEKQIGSKKFRVKRIPADANLRFSNPEKLRANIESIDQIKPSGEMDAYELPKVKFDPLPGNATPATIAVDANKMNVFYTGVNNPITVAVPGYDCADLQVRLSGNGALIPAGGCQYFVQVLRPGAIRIEVFTKKNGQEVQLGVKSFRAKFVPDPVPYLEDYSDSTKLRQAEIRNAMGRELQAIIQNFDYDASCSIERFTLAMWKLDSDVLEVPIQGNKIPDKLLDYMESFPAGSKIYFLDIFAKCPGDAAARKLGDLVFKVVE